MPAENPNSYPKEKKAGRMGPISISLAIHLGLMFLVGSVVVIEQVVPKSHFKETIPGENLDQPASEEPPADEPIADPTGSTAPEMPLNEAPLDASSNERPMETITVDSAVSSMSFVASTPVLGNPAASKAQPEGSTNSKVTAKETGRIKAVTSFFGMEAEAEGIGFFLDYSGSMDGPKREKLLKELEKSLEALPNGFPVMVVAWAGPAWDLTQQASQVRSYWKMTSASQADMLPTSKQNAPEWIKLSGSNRKMILAKLAAMQSAPGGTDWRSPFRLAAKAEVFPPVIFFMSDGQFGSGSPFEKDIADIIEKTGEKSVVNVVAFGDVKEKEGDGLKSLARKFKGKTVMVK